MKSAVIPPGAARFESGLFGRRVGVFLEATLVMLLIPVSRMAFKYLAPHSALSTGILQLQPGVVFVAIAICASLFFRKAFCSHGVTLSGWRESVKLAVPFSLIHAAGVVAALPVFKAAGIHQFNGWDSRGNLLAICFYISGLVLFALILRHADSIIQRIPTFGACAVLVALWVTPVGLALSFGHPIGSTGMVFVHAVILSGLGEEFIFRGYIQSRLNQAFGRPFRFGTIQFGWGLFIAAFLFGLVHIFNGVDLVEGRFAFQWIWGLGAFLGGLFSGFVREKTGSILGSAIIHGDTDLWVILIHSLK